MCGILGVVGPDRVARARINGSLDLLHHRGPDAKGVEESGVAAFGHTLLSIIGKQPVIQPLSSRAEDIVLTFNGEIYNYIELLEEDSALRARCDGTSDSQVLLEGLSLY